MDENGEWVECPECGGTGTWDDCYEDTCVCLNPPCKVSSCDFCEGKGGWSEPQE